VCIRARARRPLSNSKPFNALDANESKKKKKKQVSARASFSDADSIADFILDLGAQRGLFVLCVSVQMNERVFSE
jgi:hypothetical protein